MEIKRKFECTCGSEVKIVIPFGVGSRAWMRTCTTCRNVWKVDDSFVVSLVGVREVVRRTWFGATDAGTEGKACHETVEGLSNEGQPWLSFCRTHERVITHESWKLARYNAEYTSEWCECCSEAGCGEVTCSSCDTVAATA